MIDIPLTQNQRRVLNALEKAGGKGLTGPDLFDIAKWIPHVSYPGEWGRRYLNALERKGLAERTGERRDGAEVFIIKMFERGKS